MQKAHQNINWENKPSTETPINETNLNLMDRSIDTIDDRVVTFDTTKANQSDLLQGVRNVTFTQATGTFHITYFNGTVIDIDTDIEKIAINFYYDSNPSSQHYQCLVLTLDDGTIEYIDMSALITQYEFTNTARIAFTVDNDGKISADIVGGSITDDKLQPQYLADITAQAQAGAQSAINASEYKLDAEAWANGTRNGQAVPSTDPAWHKNSRYWSQQANVTSFVALTDVDVDPSTLADGQYPAYDSDTGMWVNRDIPQADAGVPVRIIVISEEGSTVTITKPNGDTVTPTHISTGHWQADFSGASAYGTYVIDAILSGDDAQVSLNVDDCKTYIVDDSHFHADIIVTYPSGATVSCAKTGEPTQYATSSPYTFTVHSTGVWTIIGTRNGITETQTVTITTNGQTESITLTIVPDGSTVTPTDSVQILLNCADIWDKTTYTTIADLIADDTSLLKVLTSDNAIDYLVRSTTFASAITADEDAMAMIGSYDYCADTLIANATWKTAIDGSAYKSSVYNAPNDTRVAGGVQTWLRSANITDKTYTTLAEVLADTTTLATLIASHDAVDYLVTAKALIDGIVADATAMSYIGLNNYCANSLLSDADWLNGICNSTYMESVLNVKVPTMTSDTTPSGVASAKSIISATYPAWKAFDKNNGENAWASNSSPTWVQYEFTSAQKIIYVVQTDYNTNGNQTWNVQASNDNFVSDINTLATYSSVSHNTSQSHVLNNNTAYKYWRLQTPNTYGTLGVVELQFYGREDV